MKLNCICIYSVNIVNYFMFIGRYYKVWVCNFEIYVDNFIICGICYMQLNFVYWYIKIII